MIRGPPRSTRTDTPFPFPTLFRSISAYPVLDLSILCLVVVAIGSAGWKVDRMWACLAGGLMLNAIADGLYTYSDFQGHAGAVEWSEVRSEEHTSELQSLMRISYAVFCLTKKTNTLEQSKHQT